MRANVAPAISGCAFTPASLIPDGTATTSLQCSASDLNGNLASVTANLTAIGGSATSALVNTSGNIWTLNNIAPTGIATGIKSISVTAKDSLALSAATTAPITITNGPPVVASCSLSPASIPNDAVGSTILSCVITDPNNNVISSSVNLTPIGGLAAVAMTKSTTVPNTWNSAAFKTTVGKTPGAYSLIVTAKDAQAVAATGTASLTVTAAAPAPPVVSACSFVPTSIAANGIAKSVLKCAVTDVNLDVSTVTANLTELGGSSSAPLTLLSGNIWQNTAVTAAGTTTLGAHTITVTATDSGGRTGTSSATITAANAAPTITGCAFTPAALIPDGITSTSLQCAASDPNSNLASVTANLTVLGGSATAALTNTSGNIWTLNNIAPTGIAAGIKSISVTAKDSFALTSATTAPITITNGPPVVVSCSLSPVSIPANGLTTSTITCVATDPNNNISLVTVNLSALGGLAATAMTKSTTIPNTWSYASIKAPVIRAPGIYTLAVTAKDALAITAAGTAALTVTAP